MRVNMWIKSNCLLLLFFVFFVCATGLYAKKNEDAPRFKRYQEVDQEFSNRVNKKRLQEIEYIKKIIRNSRLGKKNKAPFVLRLAELYWEQARFEFDREVRTYSKVYERWKKNKIGSEPQPDHRKSRNLYTQSVSTAGKVVALSKKPTYKVKALYFMGFNLIEIGKGERGVKYLKRIHNDYKRQNKYFFQATTKLADYYFDKGQAMAALSYYKKLLSIPDKDFKGYVLYKIAWCYTKIGRGEKAMKSFEKVRLYLRDNAPKGRNKINLLDETENDIVKAFAIFRKARQAKAYFRRIFGGDALRSRLTLLAKIYYLKGIRHSAVTIYRAIISLKPLDENNLDFEIKIFDLLKQPFNLKLVKKHIAHLISHYGEKTGWHSRHGKAKKAQIKIEEIIRISATTTHEIAKKRQASKKNKTTPGLAYAGTLEMYSMYLSEFPNHKHAYRIRFLYAQILFDIKKYREATKQFLSLYEKHPKGKHSKIVVLNLVASHDQLRLKKGKKYNDLKEHSISKVEQDFIRSVKYFEEVYPKDSKRLDELNFKAATIYYNYNQFPKAIKLYEKLMNNSKDKDIRKASAFQIMSIYKRKNDLKGLSAFAVNIMKNPQLRRLSAKLKLKSILENAELSRASQLEKTGKLSEAAELYFDIYQKFPSSKYARKSLFNSLVLFRKAREIDDVNKINLIIISRYPRDQIAISSYKDLAKNHNASGEYGKAASYFIKLFNSGLVKDKKERLSLIYNASKLYYLLNNYSLAIKYYSEIRRRFPRQAEGKEAILMLAKIQELKRNYRKAIQLYTKYISSVRLSKDDLSYYYIKFANWYKKRLRSTGQANMYYRKILAFNPRSLKSGIEYYSEAKFNTLSKQYRYFFKNKNVQKAQAVMNKLLRSYKEIISLGNPKWALAALVRAGGLYSSFARIIDKAPLPSKRELGGVTIEEYKEEVGKVVRQNEKEAKEYFKTAIKQGNRHIALTDFMFEAKAKLNALKGLPPKSRGLNIKNDNYLVITDNTKEKIFYEKR